MALAALWLAFSLGGPLTPAAFAQEGPFTLLVVIHGDEAMGLLSGPQALWLANDQLVLADTGNRRLLLFDASTDKFKYQAEFTAQGKLDYPVSVVLTPKGELLVIEQGKKQVTLCDPKAGSLSALKLGDFPQAQTFWPRKLYLDSQGALYIIEAELKRILIFAPDLTFRREIRVAEPFRGFASVGVDRRGDIYGLEEGTGRILVFEPSGALKHSFGTRGPGAEEFDFPVDIALDFQGNIYVADAHRNDLQVYSPRGTFQGRFFKPGWKEGFLFSPSFLFIDAQNRLFIIEQGNNRVQVFSPSRPR